MILQSADDARWNFLKLVAGIGGVFAIVALAGLVWIASMTTAWPRDLNSTYANKNPALHEWFDKLKSGKGLCCSYADGVSIEDVDWDMGCVPAIASVGALECSFKVRLEGQWILVPDDALILEPNLARTAVVWPYKAMERGVEKTKIRCFIPGSGT